MNRATTLMKMRNFEGAILDFHDIETKINNESEEEKKDPFYPKMMSRMLIKRAACNAWVSEFDKAEEDFQRAVKEYKGLYSEAELKYIESDLEKINRRKESNVHKDNGDLQYGQGNFDEAMKHYHK